MRIQQSVTVIVLGLVIAGSIVAWVLWPDEGAVSQEFVDPVAVSRVLQQLAPGTTLHMVDVNYRRHGPDTPAAEGPQTRRVESWATFDDQGALVDYREETRDMDGTLLGTATLDSDDLVRYDPSGLETRRIPNFRLGLTVDSLKASIVEAITNTAAALAAQLDAPTTTLGATSVLVLEERRQALRAPNRGEGYSIPYIADLNAVEELRLDYVLPDASHALKSEVVIVSEDGTETVVESRDHTVFEVIPSQAGANQ